jgi:arylsulfatase A-like enzyme
MPLIVRWPGVTPATAECHEPVVAMDLFATLLGAAGLTPAANTTLDGLDLRPLLRNPAGSLPRDALYFHYPHYYETTTPVGAVRARDWKLLEYFEDNHVELFNLRDDPSEQTNLAAQQPEKAEALRQQLHAWRQSVGAAMPTPNPTYTGKKK